MPVTLPVVFLQTRSISSKLHYASPVINFSVIEMRKSCVAFLEVFVFVCFVCVCVCVSVFVSSRMFLGCRYRQPDLNICERPRIRKLMTCFLPPTVVRVTDRCACILL